MHEVVKPKRRLDAAKSKLALHWNAILEEIRIIYGPAESLSHSKISYIQIGATILENDNFFKQLRETLGRMHSSMEMQPLLAVFDRGRKTPRWQPRGV